MKKNEYLVCLSNSNEFDLIIFHYFVFILGLNISEWSILKVNNFSKNYSRLKFYKNKKLIKRIIDNLFSVKLKLYIEKNNFLQTDYIIYLFIKNKKSENRILYLKNRFSTFLNTIITISEETKK